MLELVQLQLLMLEILLDDTDIRSLSAYSFFCSHFKMFHVAHSVCGVTKWFLLIKVSRPTSRQRLQLRKP
jgi:hypothetical protein